MSGNGDVAAGAHQNLRSDSFLSDDGQVTGLWPTSGGLLYSERGGGAAGSAATPHRFALRRDQETVDCDMPDRLHADLLTPPRHDMLNFGSPSDVGIIGPDPRHVPEMDDINIDIFDHGGNKPGTCLLPGMCFTFWKEGFYEARQRVTDTERTDL